MSKRNTRYNQKLFFNLKYEKNQNLLWYPCYYTDLIKIMKQGLSPIKTNNNSAEIEDHAKVVSDLTRTEKSLIFKIENKLFYIFWKKIKGKKIDPNLIVFLGIELKNLLSSTTKKWIYSEENNTIQIIEPIPAKTISAIVFKKENNIEELKKIIKNEKLLTKIFFGANLIN